MFGAHRRPRRDGNGPRGGGSARVRAAIMASKHCEQRAGGSGEHRRFSSEAGPIDTSWHGRFCLEAAAALCRSKGVSQGEAHATRSIGTWEHAGHGSSAPPRSRSVRNERRARAYVGHEEPERLESGATESVGPLSLGGRNASLSRRHRVVAAASLGEQDALRQWQSACSRLDPVISQKQFVGCRLDPHRQWRASVCSCDCLFDRARGAIRETHRDTNGARLVSPAPASAGVANRPRTWPAGSFILLQCAPWASVRSGDG